MKVYKTKDVYKKAREDSSFLGLSFVIMQLDSFELMDVTRFHQ